MSIIRKRNAGHKSYIPNNSRDNQYILAEFSITDDLVQRFSKVPFQAEIQKENFYTFYQALAKILFDLSEIFDVENCQFIANDKIARVRFGQEMHQWQTNQQILFYYNPESHQLQKTFFDANKRAKKISLLFLTSGKNIRDNAASFHTKISQLVLEYAKELSLDESCIRLRDHQHITYDLFAKNKPNNQDDSLTTQAHKLRPINERYASQNVDLPKYHSAMTYAIVNIPLSNRLLSMVEIDPTSNDPYNPLYSYLTETFTQASKQFNLNNGALIANGLVPIVRYSIHDIVSRIGELQMLGYNPEQNPCGIVSKWDASELVDNVQLIFVATDKNKTEQGFGRFLNQIENCLKLMATELKMESNKDEIIIRFHQHVAYNF
jgi:hypothetical protein